MADDSLRPFAAGNSRRRRWTRWSAALVPCAAVVFFAVPALAGVPAQLVRGCGAWIAAAGGLELLSAVGFVLVFKLVWAAFRAFGHATALSVLVMGYVVGSLAGALPVPAGLGALDAGLIGALILYGAPAAPTAAAALPYRGISLSVPVALGAVGWTRRRNGVHARRRSGERRRTASDLVTASAETS